MRIYRFTPRVDTFAHPSRSLAGRWWPDAIDLGPVMEWLHDMSTFGLRPHADGRYDAVPDELALSDFPVLSLQVPVVSERAAEVLEADLAGRLHPVTIGHQRCFAVQPLLASPAEPDAFVPEESSGVRLPHGEIVHFHTRAFDPDRLRGEFFTIPDHEPYAETYVTGDVVDRARAAGLTGLDDLEVVFDDAPVPPTGARPPTEPSGYRRELEWELFRGRGSLWSYSDDELRPAFRAAVLAGLLTV